MQAAKDKYDDAISLLENNGTGQLIAWACPTIAFGGCLFGFLGCTISEPACGCPTLIKRRPTRCAEGAPELTAEIKADPLIPNESPDEFHLLSRQQLERFAYYQRKYDVEVRHKKGASSEQSRH